MFKLHHDYRISGVKNRKLGLQRVGRFLIKRRISFLSYKLELPTNIKIYLIVLVVNLKPLPSGADLYDRPYDDYSSAVKEVSID